MPLLIKHCIIPLFTDKFYQKLRSCWSTRVILHCIRMWKFHKLLTILLSYYCNKVFQCPTKISLHIILKWWVNPHKLFKERYTVSIIASHMFCYHNNTHPHHYAILPTLIYENFNLTPEVPSIKYTVDIIIEMAQLLPDSGI